MRYIPRQVKKRRVCSGWCHLTFLCASFFLLNNNTAHPEVLRGSLRVRVLCFCVSIHAPSSCMRDMLFYLGRHGTGPRGVFTKILFFLHAKQQKRESGGRGCCSTLNSGYRDRGGGGDAGDA